MKSFIPRLVTLGTNRVIAILRCYVTGSPSDNESRWDACLVNPYYYYYYVPI